MLTFLYFSNINIVFIAKMVYGIQTNDDYHANLEDTSGIRWEPNISHSVLILDYDLTFVTSIDIKHIVQSDTWF